MRSLELTPAELPAIDILRRPDVMTHWRPGTQERRSATTPAQRICASTALGVVTVPGESLTDYARGGAAAEAVWITAQQHGLAVQPISPMFLLRTRVL